MKILFPYSGVACVSFPVGKLENGGTCEFATKQCLEECAASKNAKESAFPGEPGYIIGYEPKQRAFRFMTERPLFLVCNRILYEMKRMKSKILYWFISGDCMIKHEKRILGIMKHLHTEEVIQCGFTRNVNLWKEAKRLGIRIALAVENKQQAGRLSIEGLIALPNYKTQRAEIYLRRKKWGACGFADYIQYDKLQFEANCRSCYDNQRGCFTFFS